MPQFLLSNFKVFKTEILGSDLTIGLFKISKRETLERWLRLAIPATWKAEIRKLLVQDQLRQNVRPPSQSISQVWGFMPAIPATQKA
jgi:hypothetical protein